MLLGLCLCTLVAHSEELVFVNDEAPYCPYALCGQGKDGFVIDLVHAIYGAKGYSVKIVNVPWKRALIMVGDGDADGVLNVLKVSAPDLTYPRTEVAQFNPVVFALKTSPWIYKNVDSFKSVRLGLIQGYGYGDDHPEFAEFLATNPTNIEWVSGVDPLSRIFKMIELGRVDATMDDMAVANYVLLQAGMQDKFKVAGPFGKLKIKSFVAFNPHKPNARRLAQEFDQAMAEFRQNGKLKAILAPYGVADWK